MSEFRAVHSKTEGNAASVSVFLNTLHMYMTYGVVCPSVLQKTIFTTAALGNIDHNPSATTTTNRSIVLLCQIFNIQHRKTKVNYGNKIMS